MIPYKSTEHPDPNRACECFKKYIGLGNDMTALNSPDLSLQLTKLHVTRF